MSKRYKFLTITNKNVCRAEQCQMLYTVEVEPPLNNQPALVAILQGLTVIFERSAQKRS